MKLNDRNFVAYFLTDSRPIMNDMSATGVPAGLGVRTHCSIA